MNDDKKATIKALIVSSIGFTFLFGIIISFINGINYAFVAAPIAGLLWGILIYFFFNSKKVKQHTQITGVEESDIIYAGGANHFKNAEAVGGKLYLLKDKLEFRSHGFNIQNHSFNIDLNEMEEIIFFNTLGLIPNGLKLKLKAGDEEKFVVNNRNTWKSAIEQQIEHYKKAG